MADAARSNCNVSWAFGHVPHPPSELANGVDGVLLPALLLLESEEFGAWEKTITKYYSTNKIKI